MKQNGNRNIMFEAALNPIDTDPVDLLFFRPVGYRCALFFHKLGVLPNTITVVSILLGISSGFFLYFEDIWYNIIGILLLLCTHLLDCTDGQLTQMTGRYSQAERILDHLSWTLRASAITPISPFPSGSGASVCRMFLFIWRYVYV